MPPSRPHSPTRRILVLGVLTAPVAAALLPAASAQTAAPGRVKKPECLADLIESGEVTHADLVAR